MKKKLQGSELTRGDYISLGKAVAKFNRTINELKNEEDKSYLPAELDYSEISKKIVKKSELDRYIKNLRNFTTNDDEIYETQSGEELTFWEKGIIDTESKQALKTLKKLLKNTNKYDKENIERLNSTIESIQNLEGLQGDDFKETIKRIHNLGRTDYEYRRALQYRENFYKALKEIEDYKNFDKFKRRLDRFKNPINFFKFTQRSEYFKDLFVRYVPGKGVNIVIGDFEIDEDAFNYALENDYGIKIE